MFLSASTPHAGPTVLVSPTRQKSQPGALPAGAGRTSSQSPDQHKHTKLCARFKNTTCVNCSFAAPYLWRRCTALSVQATHQRRNSHAPPRRQFLLNHALREIGAIDAGSTQHQTKGAPARRGSLRRGRVRRSAWLHGRHAALAAAVPPAKGGAPFRTGFRRGMPRHDRDITICRRPRSTLLGRAHVVASAVSWRCTGCSTQPRGSPGRVSARAGSTGGDTARCAACAAQTRLPRCSSRTWGAAAFATPWRCCNVCSCWCCARVTLQAWRPRRAGC